MISFVFAIPMVKDQQGRSLLGTRFLSPEGVPFNVDASVNVGVPLKN